MHRKYKISKENKVEIAQNLIDVLEKDVIIVEEARKFICNWILTDSKEKSKAFFDVWEIVLNNYLPKARPILFRSCSRISKNGQIVSFTSRLDCARRFSQNKGLLIICDTKEILAKEDILYNCGEYKHTFYPIIDVLIKAKNAGGWGFPETILNNYIGEEEFIMRINHGYMNALKWHKCNH